MENTDGEGFLRQFGSQAVGAVTARIKAGDPAGPCRGAGRVHRTRTVKSHPALGQSVQIWRFHFRIQVSQSHPMLLIAGDEQNVLRHEASELEEYDKKIHL